MIGRDGSPPLPPRVLAALKFLDHCYSLQHQCDASSPAIGLTAQEQSVRRSALRVLSLYFEGEMDFGDVPPTAPKPGPDDPTGPAPVPVPT
jgi:hypothetical protein